MAVLTAAAARAGTSNNAVAGQLCDFKQVCPNSCHWCQPCTAADPWPAAILLSSQVVAFYSFAFFFSHHRSLRSTRSKSPARSPLRERAPLRPSLRSTSPLKRTDAASARPGTSNGRQGAVLLARKTRIAALAEPKERRMTGIKPNSDCHPWH